MNVRRNPKRGIPTPREAWNALFDFRDPDGSSKIAEKGKGEMPEIVDTGEIRTGSSFPLRFEMNFSQPPDWEQDQAWIVVKLKNNEAEEGVAVLRVDGTSATLLPVDEMKEFIEALFHDMPK